MMDSISTDGLDDCICEEESDEKTKEEKTYSDISQSGLQAGKTKSVVAPSKPLNSRLIGELQSSSLVTSIAKAIHAVVTGLTRLSHGGSFDDRPGVFLPITPENYESAAERIKSFVGWPLNEAVHPEQLARVGFVYTGEGALVQCFQCGVKYRHWYKGDVPLNVHQKCNPHCPFLQTLTSKSKSSPAEQRPTRLYVRPESLGSNTQCEEVSKYSFQFPDYNKETVRLQSFKHWGGVLPAQELAEGGFYMIARCDVVRCFSCNVVVQDWERSFSVTYHIHKDVYYGVPNIMSIKHQLSWKSKGANEVLVNNDKEQIKLIQHSPDWWSNPPWVSSDDSDKRFHEAQSQISLRPSKTKIMAWWSLCMLNILVSPFNFPPQWEGPVDYQSMAEAGFVYTGQEDLVYCFSCNINLDRWSKDMEPLLRHKEESPNCHKLQAIEGGKGEAPPSEPLEETSTGLNEQCLSYGNDACGVSVLVVGTSYDLKESSKTTASVNLAVQADYGDFSTSFTTHPPPQPSIEAAQLVPLPHFMNVTRRSGVLPFPDSTAVDYSDQQSLFPSFGDQGVICPPDFDVAMPSPSDAQTPSVPVQSSEADGCSAVLINQPMKTAFVGCDPSADVYKRPLILILHYSVLSRNKMVN